MSKQMNFTARPSREALLGANVRLRLFCVALGLCWAALFPIVALRYQLQTYGDGSLFAYALAAQEAWAFHWHNISGRATVYLLAHAPAEAYLALTGNASGAIALYGLLFFSAPLLGLWATFALDRTPKRTLFIFACVSTGASLPLVYGFPTEMWVAHALFWPTLAQALDADDSRRSRLLQTALFAALVLTHGGGVVLAFVVLAALGLRGLRDVRLIRAAKSLGVALVLWAFMLVNFRPDAYIADAISGAAFNFINVENVIVPATRLMAIALTIYSLLYLGARRLGVAHAHMKVVVIVAASLVAYWTLLDESVLTEMRYPMRTAVMALTPTLGLLAAAYALSETGSLRLLSGPIEQVLDLLRRTCHPHFLAGALMLVTLMHAVETAKFTAGWSTYLTSVRNLAMSAASDPQLGSPRFVSAHRLGEERNQFAWGSTTHFLSVLVAPGMKPERLVVDPDTNYFWLSCPTATANMAVARRIPLESRQMIRTHACLHR
jgi:hypothetical protein